MIREIIFKYIISFLLLIPNLSQVQAQTFLVHNYLKEDGLPDLTVYDICQDNHGNIWFATKSGITKYESSEWTYYFQNESTFNQIFKFVRTDKTGRIWTLTDNNGISIKVYSNGYWSEVYHSDSLEIAQGSVRDFLVTKNKENQIALFTKYTGGLFIFKNDSVKQIPELQNLKINSLREFENKIYAVTDISIYVSSDGESFKELIPEKTGRIPTLIKDISIEYTKDGAQLLWILGEGRIYKLNDEKQSVFDLKSGTRGSNPKKIFVTDYYGHLVVGNNEAVYLVDKDFGKTVRLGEENGLNFEGANNVFADLENNLWVVGNKGVSKISSMRFSSYSEHNGLLNNNINSIVELNNKSILLGHPDGLTVFSNGNCEKIYFSGNVQSYSRNYGETNLLNTGNNVLIASSVYGFGKLVNRHVNWYNKNLYNNESAVAAVIDPKRQIWAVTKNSLFRFNNGTFNKITLPGKFENIEINNIALGRDDEILLATNGIGIVFRTRDGVWGQFYSKELYTNNIINNIVYIENILLAGSAEGLVTVQNGELQSYNINELNISEPVLSIFQDKTNQVWIGTNSGIYKWGRDRSYYFGTRQGLAGLEIGKNSVIQDNNGKVWIGTDDGLSGYNPEFDNNSKFGPIITIETFEAGGNPVPVFENKSVAYDKNNFLFKINIGSYIDEKINRYTVMLEGFDTSWVPEMSGINKFVRYTNLSPGQYRLHVKAKDAMGNWCSPITTGIITVKKPFYKETWFFVPVIILIGIIIFSLVIYFERARYAEKLEVEVKERTRQIEDSRKRYHRMFEYNKAMLLVVDADSSEIVDANPAAYAYYGSLINPERPVPLKLLEAEIKNENPYTEILNKLETGTYYTTRHKVRNGDIRDVELYFSRFSTDEGKLFFVIVHDITDQKKSEEQVKKLSTAVEQSSQMIFITNTEGIIEYVNPTFCAITGFEPEEAIGKKPNILKSGKRDAYDYQTLWNCISAGKNYSGEFLNKKKNGDLIWVSALVTPVRDNDNRITHFLAVEEDITEKKLAQQELVRSEAKVKAILNAIPDLMMQISSDGKLIGCHYSGNVKLLSEPDSDIGKNVAEILPGEFAGQLLEKVPQIISDDNLEIFEYQYSGNGNTNYYECRLAKNDDKTVLVILRDITQRKLFEADIILAKEEAEKSDKLKTEFLANMSHEMRTPVNSIVNFAEIISEDLKDKLQPHVFEKLSMLESNSRRLLKTVDAIVDIAKIQSGAYKADFEIFNIVNCLRSVVTDLEQSAVEKNIVMSFTSKIESSDVYGDYFSIREIFFHLIDNAIKFTNAGTVKININSIENNKIRVDIVDTGIGISEEFSPKIFTAFSQENAGYSRSYEGNGLGLALVKNYCAMNEVKIDFISEKGKGSAFSLIFKNQKTKRTS